MEIEEEMQTKQRVSYMEYGYHRNIMTGHRGSAGGRAGQNEMDIVSTYGAHSG